MRGWSIQSTLQLEGGHCNGPLFAPIKARRAAKFRPSGGKEVWAKYKRACPPWSSMAEMHRFWRESKRRTAETGIPHSVDHIVPLRNPIVCGLHCPANIEILPLVANIAKGNAWWPDMPEAQLGLPGL